MRPHIRSSAEFRRRSIAGIQDSAGGDLQRRRNTTASLGFQPDVTPLHRRTSLTSTSNTSSGQLSHRLLSFGSTNATTSAANGNGTNSGVLRSSSSSSPPKRDSLGVGDRRDSSLDCSRHAVNSFRIKILVLSFVIGFIVVVTFRYLT